ncbi:hypothetical protein ACMC56_09530 [Campylobacterota bacterium DY0563]
MKLQEAGAGLPTIERLFIKTILVPGVRTLCTWNMAAFLLKRELKIIKKLVSKVDKEKLTQKVIIDRVFAIEDHTRQFSINMVLEHLVIAGSLMKNIIETLSKEENFIEDVKIQNVKPNKNIVDEYTEFEIFYNNYLDFIKRLPKKQSKMKKRHPWFINFNNYDWSVFMFMHTFIHRRQIEAIIKELK